MHSRPVKMLRTCRLRAPCKQSSIGPIGVRSADGTELHAEVFGSELANSRGADRRGAGSRADARREQTFVLARGWTEMLSDWTYVIRDLSDKGFRIVAYDVRDHGQSEPRAAGCGSQVDPTFACPEDAEMLPQLAKLIVLPDTSHMGPLERPREISQALAQLAAAIAPGTSTVAATN